MVAPCQGNLISVMINIPGRDNKRTENLSFLPGLLTDAELWVTVSPNHNIFNAKTGAAATHG